MKMKNGIIKYIEEYGHLTFKEKEFNEIDAAIFSVLSYIDFEGIVSEAKDKIALNMAFCLINNKIVNKEIVKRGKFNKDIYNMFSKMATSKRYKDIMLFGYVYKTGFSEQFGALSLLLDDGTLVISYEGTDDKLAGWREDMELTYKFPIASEDDAIKYFKKHVNLFTKKVVLVGHSKGGHLALTTGIFADFIRRSKIKNIYNFDGPGLLKEQIESKKYLNIENRLIHIVPNYSIVGLLLRHGDYICVKSNKKDISAHFCFNWVVEEDHFLRTNISVLSERLDKSIIIWLDNHNYEQRERIVTNFFDYLQDSGIESVSEMKKIKTIVNLVKNSKKLDKETKDVLLNFIEFNVSYVVSKEQE